MRCTAAHCCLRTPNNPWSVSEESLFSMWLFLTQAGQQTAPQEPPSHRNGHSTLTVHQEKTTMLSLLVYHFQDASLRIHMLIIVHTVYRKSQATRFKFFAKFSFIDFSSHPGFFFHCVSLFNYIKHSSIPEKKSHKHPLSTLLIY